MNVSLEGKALAVEVKGNGALLALYFLSRISQKEQNIWDSNFVSVRIEASVSGFQARFDDSLNLIELQQFREDIARLYRELQGEATLEAMDGFLEVTAKVEAWGIIDWNILMQYPGGTGAQLRFEIGNDQSYLPALLRQINAVFATFPLWKAETVNL